MVRYIIAIIATFVVWSVLDMLIHGMVLAEAYEATADLWRPMEEMKMGFMYLTTGVASLLFVTLFGVCVNPKSVSTGLQFGFLYGLATGIPMGFGSYSVMPIPITMAVVWALGTLVQTALAGLLLGLIIDSNSQRKPEP